MRREQVHMMLDVLLDMGQKLVSQYQTPPEAKEHFKSARRETLLGIRAIVDSAIERLDAAPTAAPTGPTKIPVEEA